MNMHRPTTTKSRVADAGPDVTMAIMEETHRNPQAEDAVTSGIGLGQDQGTANEDTSRVLSGAATTDSDRSDPPATDAAAANPAAADTAAADPAAADPAAANPAVADPAAADPTDDDDHDPASDAYGSRPSLGDRLRKLMADRGLSQVDLARDSGLDRADLNRLINNKRPPRAEEIRVIAQTLGIRQIELVTGVELPPEVEKGVEMIVELEATVLAERQQRERLEAELAALRARDDASEKAIEAERTASLRAKFEMAQEHRRELSEMRAAHQTELVEVRQKQAAHVDDLNSKHALQTMQLQQALQARDAEIGRRGAAIAQLQVVSATLEAQNHTLRKQLTAQANDANTQALLAGLAGLAFGGLGAAAASSSRKKR